MSALRAACSWVVIRAHAAAEYPRECCGLVALQGRRESYWPCRNPAEGIGHFILDPQDYYAAEQAGPVTALVHSHPDMPATPSEADGVACEGSGLPWFIVAAAKDDAGQVLTGDLFGFAPEGYQAPLLGRPFAHGILDCYSVVRDPPSVNAPEGCQPSHPAPGKNPALPSQSAGKAQPGQPASSPA